MSDYVTHRDTKPTTVSHTLFLALKRRDGQTTAELAARVRMASKHCSALLGDLEQNGWVTRTLTLRRVGRGGPKLAQWFLTDKARTQTRTPLPYRDTAVHVLAALTGGTRSVRELTAITGRPRRTVAHAVRRLAERYEVETYTERNVLYVRKPLGELDDDGWTPPTTYISAARAYALGLK